MALTHTLAGAVAGQLPKVVSPRAHSFLDYATAGAFLIAGALFWRRNRRAALASLAQGGALAGVALLTEYAGRHQGTKRLISYRTHGRIEAGLPALTAALPRLAGFAETPEARFFTAAAITQAAVAGLTDFEAETSRQIEAA